MKRFWDKVRRGRGCWAWIGATNDRGYGQFLIGSRTDGSRRVVGAHRLAWELTFGAVPEGKSVCHRCDHPWCCNPAHLFVGTHTDNMRDMWKKERHARVGQKGGAGHTQAKLTPEQVEAIRASAGREPQTRLAARFGITQSQVSRILRGAAWKV